MSQSTHERLLRLEAWLGFSGAKEALDAYLKKVGRYPTPQAECLDRVNGNGSSPRGAWVFPLPPNTPTL